MEKSTAQFSNIIYIIDEDLDDNEILTELINKLKPEFSCTSFQNREDGLDAIRAATPQYVFLSIDLPQVRGDDFLRELQQLQELSNTYIVAQVTAKTPDVEEMLISHGASIVIEKPWNMAEYLDILKNIFRQY